MNLKRLLKFDRERAAALGAIIFVVGSAAFPLWSHAGIINSRGGGDSPFLLQRVHQLTTAIPDSHIPVRWMADANYGYGYPFFHYYAPLSIYIAAAFKLLGFEIAAAIKLAQISGFVAAALWSYQLGRRWFHTKAAATLAAVAYTLAPFHLVNIYVRGDSLAEFWAMAFYPLCLLGVDKIAENGERKSWATLAIAYAGLILSHNISALIFTPFLGLYILIRRLFQPTFRRPFPHNGFSPPNRQSRSLTPFLISIFIALALSAWFWLPALGEQNLAQLDPVTAGYFHYSGHFRGWDLAQGSLVFDYGYESGDGRPFRMGLIQATLAGIGLAALFWRREISWGRRWYIFLAFALSTLMITPLSAPLWDNVPLLPFTQFPWRFLSVQAFIGALAAGVVADDKRYGWHIAGIAGILLLIANLAGLRPDYVYLPSDEFVTARRLAEYEWFTGNIGSTVSAEYLPPTMQPRPYSSGWLQAGANRAVFLTGEGAANLEESAAHRQRWGFHVVSNEALIQLPTMFWAGWEAETKGEAVKITLLPSGLIGVKLPAGEHDLILQLSRTPIRLAAELVSLIALGVALLLWGRNISWRWIGWVAAIAGILIAAAFWLSLSQYQIASTSENWDFAQMGYRHWQRHPINYSNGAKLFSFEAQKSQAAPGETIRFVANLEHEGRGQVALISPAGNRHPHTPLIASDSQKASQGNETYELTIPEDAPAGLFVSRLRLDGGTALTPAGLKRGDLYFQPIRILPANSEPFPPSRHALDARPLEIIVASDHIETHLAYWTSAPLQSHLNFSLRLSNSLGVTVAQFDHQPGYGFNPTLWWEAGGWTIDWVSLPLDKPLPAETLHLTVRLYDAVSGNTVLLRRLGDIVSTGETHQFIAHSPLFVAHSPLFEMPTDAADPIAIHFDGVVDLAAVSVQQDGDWLDVKLIWQAVVDGERDLYHFIHLIDPQTGEIVAQHDSMPQQNSYPTSQWVAGEFVIDHARLDISEASGGNYQAAIGLFAADGDGFVRLLANDAAGRELPDNRYLLPATITRE